MFRRKKLPRKIKAINFPDLNNIKSFFPIIYNFITFCAILILILFLRLLI